MVPPIAARVLAACALLATAACSGGDPGDGSAQPESSPSSSAGLFGPPSPGTVASDPPDGMQWVVDEASGIQFAVPASWTIVSGSTRDVEIAAAAPDPGVSVTVRSARYLPEPEDLRRALSGPGAPAASVRVSSVDTPLGIAVLARAEIHVPGSPSRFGDLLYVDSPSALSASITIVARTRQEAERLYEGVVGSLHDAELAVSPSSS